MYYCNELFFRIIGHDETPQFLNYGKSGQSKVQLISGKGDNCNNLTKKNKMSNNPPVLYIKWQSCYVPNNFCRDRFVIFTANIN